MEENRINTSTKMERSLVKLLNNILFQSKIEEEDFINSLFGIIVIDILLNKEKMVENVGDITYESKMSDDQLEEIFSFLDIENMKVDQNGATVFATIRNKLAHGDYYLKDKNIIFRINDKDVSVSLYLFINYYMLLTDCLSQRFKEKKYTKYQLTDKSGMFINKMLETDKDIKDFLKSISLKKMTLRRKDGQELTSAEKNRFSLYTLELRKKIKQNIKTYDSDYDKMVKSEFSDNYYVDISKHKMYKVDDVDFNEIKRTVNFYKYLYDKDSENLNIYLFVVAEKIYSYMYNKYEENQVQYSFESLKKALFEAIQYGIFDFGKFLKERNKIDSCFGIIFPDEESLLCIMIAIMYFTYCYPLETLFKTNKTFEYNEQDMDFSKIDFSEIIPNIKFNKIYEMGKNNRINELNTMITSYNNSIKQLENNYNKIENQHNNVLKKYEENKDKKYEEILEILKDKLNDIKNKIEEYNKLLKIKNKELEESNIIFSDDNNTFYGYTIINGIRNAICHGNIKFKNLHSEIKDLTVEFTDLYENEEFFKLDISLHSLMSLTEENNMKHIRKFYNDRKIKTLTTN